MKTIAFFNNKGGVGKTSLVYHLSWMYSDLGVPVIAADLDPQANLTAMFLDERGSRSSGRRTPTPRAFSARSLRSCGVWAWWAVLIRRESRTTWIRTRNLGLSRFEAKLSTAWPNCMDGDESAFRTVSSFYRILHEAAERTSAEVVLIDVGPNLGAIDR